jgi:uncharacterized protein YuzE
VATVTSRKKAIAGALALAKQIGKLPASKLWLDYDAEADVLYIGLKRPQKATETIEVNDGTVLLRFRGDVLVGITVLEASKR